MHSEEVDGLDGLVEGCLGWESRKLRMRLELDAVEIWEREGWVVGGLELDLGECIREDSVGGGKMGVTFPCS